MEEKRNLQNRSSGLAEQLRSPQSNKSADIIDNKENNYSLSRKHISSPRLNKSNEKEENIEKEDSANHYRSSRSRKDDSLEVSKDSPKKHHSSTSPHQKNESDKNDVLSDSNNRSASTNVSDIDIISDAPGEIIPKNKLLKMIREEHNNKIKKTKKILRDADYRLIQYHSNKRPKHNSHSNYSSNLNTDSNKPNLNSVPDDIQSSGNLNSKERSIPINLSNNQENNSDNNKSPKSNRSFTSLSSKFNYDNLSPTQQRANNSLENIASYQTSSIHSKESPASSSGHHSHHSSKRRRTRPQLVLSPVHCNSFLLSSAVSFDNTVQNRSIKVNNNGSLSASDDQNFQFTPPSKLKSNNSKDKKEIKNKPKPETHFSSNLIANSSSVDLDTVNAAPEELPSSSSFVTEPAINAGNSLFAVERDIEFPIRATSLSEASMNLITESLQFSQNEDFDTLQNSELDDAFSVDNESLDAKNSIKSEKSQNYSRKSNSITGRNASNISSPKSESHHSSSHKSNQNSINNINITNSSNGRNNSNISKSNSKSSKNSNPIVVERNISGLLDNDDNNNQYYSNITGSGFLDESKSYTYETITVEESDTKDWTYMSIYDYEYEEDESKISSKNQKEESSKQSLSQVSEHQYSQNSKSDKKENESEKSRKSKDRSRSDNQRSQSQSLSHLSDIKLSSSSLIRSQNDLNQQVLSDKKEAESDKSKDKSRSDKHQSRSRSQSQSQSHLSEKSADKSQSDKQQESGNGRSGRSSDKKSVSSKAGSTHSKKQSSSKSSHKRSRSGSGSIDLNESPVKERGAVVYLPPSPRMKEIKEDLEQEIQRLRSLPRHNYDQSSEEISSDLPKNASMPHSEKFMKSNTNSEKKESDFHFQSDDDNNAQRPKSDVKSIKSRSQESFTQVFDRVSESEDKSNSFVNRSSHSSKHSRHSSNNSNERVNVSHFSKNSDEEPINIRNISQIPQDDERRKVPNPSKDEIVTLSENYDENLSSPQPKSEKSFSIASSENDERLSSSSSHRSEYNEKLSSSSHKSENMKKSTKSKESNSSSINDVFIEEEEENNTSSSIIHRKIDFKNYSSSEKKQKNKIEDSFESKPKPKPKSPKPNPSIFPAFNIPSNSSSSAYRNSSHSFSSLNRQVLGEEETEGSDILLSNSSLFNSPSYTPFNLLRVTIVEVQMLNEMSDIDVQFFVSSDPQNVAETELSQSQSKRHVFRETFNVFLDDLKEDEKSIESVDSYYSNISKDENSSIKMIDQLLNEGIIGKISVLVRQKRQVVSRTIIPISTKVFQVGKKVDRWYQLVPNGKIRIIARAINDQSQYTSFGSIGIGSNNNNSTENQNLPEQKNNDNGSVIDIDIDFDVTANRSKNK